MLTFCSSVHPEISFLACAWALAQAGLKSGMRSDPGGGGEDGEVAGKTPGMGEAEGTGNDENGYEEIGSVCCAVGIRQQL